MGILYPNAWAVCRVTVAGADRVAWARRRKVLVWDPETGRTDTVGRAAKPTLALCEVSLGGRPLLASAGVDGAVHVWDPTQRREVTRLTDGVPDRVTALCRIPGRRDDLIACAGNGGELVVLDPSRGRLRRVLAGGGSGVQDVCWFTANGSDRLASVALDGTVSSWDPQAGTRVRMMNSHVGFVQAVCTVTVDGRQLVASAGDDGVVRLWQPSSGELVREWQPVESLHVLSYLSTGGGVVHALAEVRYNGNTWLAVGGDFPGLVLWEPATGREVGWLGWRGLFDREPRCGWVRSLAACRHKGRPHVAACGYDKTVVLLDVVADRVVLHL